MEWLRRKCKTCFDGFYVLSSWASPPVHCDACRVRNIKNIRRKLSDYVENRKKMVSRPVSSDIDRSFIEEEGKLLGRIACLIKEVSDDKELLVAVAADKELTKMVLNIEKKIKINKKLSQRLAQQKYGIVSDSQVTKIVQGGAPGLGKK